MHVKFRRLAPDLMVKDIAGTAMFYKNRLGFNIDMAVPSGKREIVKNIEEGVGYDYALVRRGDVFIMFMDAAVYGQDIPELKGIPLGASASLYCEVEGIKDLYHEYRESGINIIKDLHATWYGKKEFYIKDCNGYILGFGENS